MLYERNLGGLYVDIIPRPDALARYGLRVGDIQDGDRERHRRHAHRHHDRGAQPLQHQRPLPPGPAQRRGEAAPGAGAAAGARRRRRGRPRCRWAPRAALRTAPRGAPGSCWPRPCPAWTAASGGGLRGGAPAAPARATPDVRRARWTWPGGMRMDAAWPRARRRPCPAAIRRRASPAAAARRRPSSRSGQLADIRITGGPPMVRDEAGPAGRLRLRRHRSGPAGHGRLRRRGQGGGGAALAAGRAEAAPGLLPQVDRAVRAAGADGRAHEGGRPADPGHRRAAALPPVPQLRRGADRAAVDPVRAGGQRLAAVPAGLPAVDGGLGGHHRAGRAGGPDRHRDDRLHRQRLRAAQARGADPRPGRHHRPRTWRGRCSACAPS